MVWGQAWSDGAAGRSGRVSHPERSLPGESPTWRGPSLEAWSRGGGEGLGSMPPGRVILGKKTFGKL